MDDIQEAIFYSLKSTKAPVQTLYTEADVVQDLWSKKLSGMSLRQIASYYPGLTFADIQRALKGIFPKSGKKRLAFGLLDEQHATVIPMSGEPIPDGTQVKRAGYCKCGAPYSPDHPRRNRCYICNPGKSANAPR